MHHMPSWFLLKISLLRLYFLFIRLTAKIFTEYLLYAPSRSIHFLSNLRANTRFFCFRRFPILTMAAFVWTVREHPAGDDKVIELVVIIIFIHNLIVGNERAPAKSRQIRSWSI